MANESAIEQVADKSQVKILVIGGVLGAVVGVLGAVALVQGKQRKGKEFNVSPSEGIRLGIIVAALIRQIYELAD